MPKKKDLSIIPCSKAKNAYDLLEDVKNVIKADPKRYNQEIWVKTVNPQILAVKNADGEPIAMEMCGYYLLAKKERNTLPECGTIGCVAGWVWAMKSDVKNQEEPNLYAQKILGLTNKQALELFNGDAVDSLIYYANTDCPLPGTQAYAEYGIAHISDFQEKHEDQLKKKKVL